MQLAERPWASVAVRQPQQLQRLLEPPFIFVCVVERLWEHDIDAGVVAVAKAVHPAESLGHAVERGQVAYQVVRRDVDADLARARADKVDGLAPGSAFGRKRRKIGSSTSSFARAREACR
jgi:hypothetical protein